MRHICALTAMLLFLAACGFEPLYGERPASSGASVALAEIAVDPIPGREGQLLKIALEDRFNPSSAPTRPIYRLSAGFAKSLVPVIIDPDASIRRYNVKLVSNFRLYDAATGADIYSGKVERLTSYNVAESDFSTYVAGDDATQRGITELAEDYKLRIAAFLARHRPK